MQEFVPVVTKANPKNNIPKTKIKGIKKTIPPMSTLRPSMNISNIALNSGSSPKPARDDFRILIS